MCVRGGCFGRARVSAGWGGEAVVLVYGGGDVAEGVDMTLVTRVSS